jgi:4-hydroxy-tetrahydrodipicolinate synthase
VWHDGRDADAHGDERRRIIELVVEEVEGRAMVLAGAGGYNTREVMHAIAEAEQAGAHGILSVTPYYNKPTQEGLYQHYKALAEHTKLPIIVYNVPGRTGCNVEPATLAHLAELQNIVGVKEASGNMTQMAEVLRAVPAEFIVLSGDDALTLPLMAIGGRGSFPSRRTRCPPRWCTWWRPRSAATSPARASCTIGCCR